MTRNELAKEVAVSEKLHLSTAVRAVDGVIRAVGAALAKGEPVIIRGFGTLLPCDTAARTARDFKTGKPVAVPPHKTVKFRIGKELLETLNPGAGKETAGGNG